MRILPVWAHAPDMQIIFWAQSADETCMRSVIMLGCRSCVGLYGSTRLLRQAGTG
jgi:hypothetical protein